MPTVLLINDTSDHGNWGSQSNIEALRRILQEQIPGVSLPSLPSRSVGRIYTWDPFVSGVRAFNRTSYLADKLSSRYMLLPSVVDEYEYVADEWLAGRGGAGAADFLARLKGVDALIFNAEGSTYRNNHSSLKCLFMLWLGKTRFGLPSYFMNGSVTLTEVDPVLPAMVKKVFTALDGVAVREPNSLRMVQQYAPQAKVELVPDTVFLFDESDCSTESAGLAALRRRLGGQPYFCFSLSMLPMDFKRTRRASALYNVIMRLKQVAPQAVLMAKDEEDQYLGDVARETGSHFFGKNQSFREVMAVLRDARFLFSGRYHHLIMAADVGCPGIPMISTSPKIKGLSELLREVMIAPFDPTDLRPHLATLENEARRLVAGGAELRAQVKAVATGMRSRVPRLGHLVREGIERRSAT